MQSCQGENEEMSGGGCRDVRGGEVSRVEEGSGCNLGCLPHTRTRACMPSPRCVCTPPPLVNVNNPSTIPFLHPPSRKHTDTETRPPHTHTPARPALPFNDLLRPPPI